MIKPSSSKIGRRTFLIGGATGLSVVALPLPRKWSCSTEALADTAESPHFFLEIVFPGGMDCLYTFDARPLALTKAGKLANFMTAEPDPLTGSNGNTILATSLIHPLKEHLDRFSVLNGVIMSTGFDGHDNNMNYLLAGNPFGGESLLPHLNQIGTPAPIDYVSAGGITGASLTNTSNTVPLTPASAAALAERLNGMSGQTLGSPLMRQLASRFDANGGGNGLFSAGARGMKAGFEKIPAIAGGIKDLKDVAGGSDKVQNLAQMIGKLFKNGLCRSVQLVLDDTVLPDVNLDTHDPKSAAASATAIGTCMTAVAAIIKYLRDTQYDDKSSLLDVTTVLVGTEFGRTMRQTIAQSLDQSGTDHNPLKNTFLIGGKGIKGGIVAGGTDFQSADEGLSGAHKSLDPDSLKMMGCPLDFSTLRPVTNAMPATYKSADYLNFDCVANTIYKLFGAPETRYRVIERNGPPAKVLDTLLA